MGLLCIQGCAKAGAQTTAKADKPVKAGSANPEEELDEARMKDAFRGLAVLNGGIVTTINAHGEDVDHQALSGERLRKKAEADMQKNNVWFTAVGEFRDAILADERNPKSYEGLARACLLEGKTDYAEPALATAINIDPKFSQAIYELGTVKQMNSDYSGAVNEWKTLTQFNPDFKDVYARMSIASYYAQDYKSAWTYLSKADQRHQSVPPQFRPLLKEAAPQP